MQRIVTATALAAMLLITPAAVLAAEDAKPADAQTPPETEDAGAKVLVKLETTMGTILLELDQEKAPITVDNFLQYVNDRFYDGLVFQRVFPNFMIQGGGFDAEMKRRIEGIRDPIKLESQNGLKNVRGTIAMARTGQPNSATCQFFINVVDNGGLDYPKPDGHGYAVFGEVIEGMDVVDKIRHVKRIRHPGYPTSLQDPPATPEEPVIIIKARQIDREGNEIEADAAKPDQPKAEKAHKTPPGKPAGKKGTK